MSYCVKHATTFHTQTCERCSDESTIARLTAEAERLSARCVTLETAALKVIEFNLREANDRYRDANRANDWACVRVLRAALHNDLAPPAKEDSDG